MPLPFIGPLQRLQVLFVPNHPRPYTKPKALWPKAQTLQNEPVVISLVRLNLMANLHRRSQTLIRVSRLTDQKHRKDPNNQSSFVQIAHEVNGCRLNRRSLNPKPLYSKP